MSLDDRRALSYNRAIECVEEHNCTPLFDLSQWRGQIEMIAGKSTSRYYPVKCNQCGTEFLSWFKVSPKSKRMTKCPNCNDGHRSRELSKDSAIKRLKSRGLTLVEGQEFKTVSDSYQVQCLTCKTVFNSPIDKRGLNCPYCSESHSSQNQLLKLKRICQDENLTLLEESYTPQFKNKKRTKFKVECNICHTQYEAAFIGHRVTVCPTCCTRKVRSNLERKICAFLESNGVEYFANYRGHGIELTPGHPMELDIYIPSKKIAFEINGQAYHNSGDGHYHKDRHYHKNKTELALSNGIKLYHLWDFNTDELNLSVVSAKTGLNTRIYARNTILKEIDVTKAKEFLDRCHVDGFVRSSKYYGLFHKEQLVAVATLMNRQLQSLKVARWEIGRFATERFVTVVGGYSKLLKKMVSDLKEMGVEALMSYCNRDLSPDPQGTFYAKQGFEFVENSGLIYWYWASAAFEFLGKQYKHSAKISRQTFQKQKLLKHFNDNGLPLPDPCTEATLCAALKCYPCFNSGNFKYCLPLK